MAEGADWIGLTKPVGVGIQSDARLVVEQVVDRPETSKSLGEGGGGCSTAA